jgi:hypothetical protein
MMLGYVYKTTKIWGIREFYRGPHGQGHVMECSNTIFEEEINAYERFISSKAIGGEVIEWQAKNDEHLFGVDDDPADQNYGPVCNRAEADNKVIGSEATAGVEVIERQGGIRQDIL